MAAPAGRKGYTYLPFRANRRPSSVNAALRSSNLPPRAVAAAPSRMTHPRSIARFTVARNSILRNVPHTFGCPSVAS